MSDAPVSRDALKARLTLKRSIDKKTGRTLATPVQMHTLLWAIAAVRALPDCTDDDRLLVTRYADRMVVCGRRFIGRSRRTHRRSAHLARLRIIEAIKDRVRLAPDPVAAPDHVAEKVIGKIRNERAEHRGVSKAEHNRIEEARARRYARNSLQAQIAGHLDTARGYVRLAGAALARYDYRPDPPEPSDPPVAVLRGLKRKRLGRFTYWWDEHINPPDRDEPVSLNTQRVGHLYLSELFRKRYASDPEAIFDFARQDARAFRSPWVIRQIEAWDAERNIAALGKLMKAYAGDTRGKPYDLVSAISADQDLYRRYREARTKGQKKTAAVEHVSSTSWDQHDHAYADAMSVCTKYDRYRASFLALHPHSDDRVFLGHLKSLLDVVRVSMSNRRSLTY